MIKTSTKIAKPLPGRAATMGIADQARAGTADLRDYSKLSSAITGPTPSAILNLAKKRR